MEIERKWLFNLENVPINLSKTITHYKQAYLSINPEVRIRSKFVEHINSVNTGKCSDTTYALCIKGNGKLVRHEIQRDITKEEFEALKEVGELNDEMFINKNYYTISIGKYILTVGIVDKGTMTEFCYGEIEFSSAEEALNFVPPTWFGKEVTNNDSYKMKNYWKNTRIKKN